MIRLSMRAEIHAKGFAMAHSHNIEQKREEQRKAMARLTPGERLLMALELADECARMNEAGRKALEALRASGTTAK